MQTMGATMRGWGFVCAVLALGGCAHTATGTLGPHYFKHNESGYELIYVGSGPAEALGPGWTLDNFQQAPARGGGTAYFPREGEAYGFERHYDFDGDGLTDYSMRRAIYDLLFTQDGGGTGRIWMRSIALAPSLEGKPLDALARRYVSKVERVGLPFEHFGEGQPAGAAERSFPARVISEGIDCEVANVPAFRLDFALEGDEGPRQVTVVLMRPGYAHQLAANGVAHRYEVVLQAVHVDAPDAFAASEPAFQTLLDHLSLARGQAENTCVPGAAEAAP